MTRSDRLSPGNFRLNCAADSFQQSQRFKVGGLREEIHRLKATQPVETPWLQEGLQIPGLSRGIAAQISQQRWRVVQDALDNALVETAR